MGSKSSQFKYGPGLLLDKTGCIIDTIGSQDYYNQFTQCHQNIVDNNQNNFQHQLSQQVQQQIVGNAEPPTYNIINLIEKPPCFENDLFMPFMKPFSTYCPQPFESLIYPPYAMPRPLPLANDFLLPFSNFCKQTYPQIQSDPTTLLPQFTMPFTQFLFPKALTMHHTVAPQLAASSALNAPFMTPSGAFNYPFYQPSPINNHFNIPTPTNFTTTLTQPALSGKYPQNFFEQQPHQQQQQGLMLNQASLNLQQQNQQKLLQQQQPMNQNFAANFNPQGGFPQSTFPTQTQTFPAQKIFPPQSFYPPQLNSLNNFHTNSFPTNSLLEHLSQILVQPAGQPPSLQPFQNAFQKHINEQGSLGSFNFSATNFKPIPIHHQQQSIQFLVPPSGSNDPRNTQPFEQQSVPNISSNLNMVRDSLGPRPIGSFDNSFGNPFISLHSLVGNQGFPNNQQPMNEPFAQSIEFLMNSS